LEKKKWNQVQKVQNREKKPIQRIEVGQQSIKPYREEKKTREAA
jgi:hypothetical protein